MFYSVIVCAVFVFISTITAFAQRVEVLSAYYGVGNYRVDITDRDHQRRRRGDNRGRAGDDTLRDTAGTRAGGERGLFEAVLGVGQKTGQLLPEICIFQDLV